MKKRKNLFFALLFATGILSACGEKQEDHVTVPETISATDDMSDFREDDDDSFREDGNDSFREDGDDSFRENGDDSFREDGDDSFREDGDGGFRELTQEELDTFTQFIHGMDAYGFLLSEYICPEEADLSEIFYSGAGLQEDMTEEEVTAYLSACNQNEMYTDCIKISRSNAEKLAEERLGIHLDSGNAEALGVYIPEFDAYYHECGDTNYMEYTCVSGLVNGNVYTLEFTADLDWNYIYSHVQTILEKTEHGYQFISNQSLVESSDDSVEISASDVDMITAWEYLKAAYFPACELEEISYDENGNLQVVIGRTEMAFGDETQERPCESILFLDEIQEDYYMFGWYYVFYDGDTVYATKTKGWYQVNRLTGEVSVL